MSKAREMARLEEEAREMQRMANALARYEALEVDARRYRYLRSVGGQTWHMVDNPKHPIRATGAYYDAAVDAAMQEESK